jgi:cytochrome c553
MCLPPLVWQTYDAKFTAAKWNAEGKKAADARVTIRQNGVVIQQNVAIPKSTTASPLKEGSSPAPIYLQDHGNPVRYRNIWIVPRQGENEARRPTVVGFERFHAGGANPAEGGRLLIGELQCTACHQADAAAFSGFRRQAPILDDVAKRVRPEYFEKFLLDPHGVKPGTMMPNVLGGMSDGERKRAAKAIANFLANTGALAERRTDYAAVGRGETLFQTIGCTACHGPKDAKNVAAVLVPLGDLRAKYSAAGLAAFLLEPHKSRPSDRMPRLVREEREALDLATYLVGVDDPKSKEPNLEYKAYFGSWTSVPPLDGKPPVKSGRCNGFDTSVAGRNDDFAVRYEGFLRIRRDGEYRFHLGSDDGSLLFIDGKKVVDADGVHPHSESSGSVYLSRGMHPLRVDYFQGGGETTVSLEYEGPGVPRQDANRSISLTNNPPRLRQIQRQPSGFEVDAGLAEQGRKLFTTVGCASCHDLHEGGRKFASTLAAPALKALKPAAGCLAENRPASKQIPDFELSSYQRAAIEAALKVGPETAAPATTVARTMTAFNCYACHSRSNVGGPERELNASFKTTTPEMGDEGRVPPPLDGVADKMDDGYLRQILEHGSKDRPYMLTRMPQFGAGDVEKIVPAFAAIDRRTGGASPALPEAEHRAKAVGKHLVGDKALGCIKCHTFGEHKISGIQTMDLQLVTRRVREEWFRRYLVDTQAYRAGTRMPASFPKGQSSLKSIYDGDVDKQLSAIWAFLKDGNRASPPDGLILNAIELKPEGRPILYRNFIEGLSTRGIAVGYPEKTHLAWDADKLCLTLLWHGRFIDASKHWEGRGEGSQSPMGDHVVKLETATPVAALKSPSDAWPTKSAKEMGYQFHGYKLDSAGRPTFHYSGPNFTVEDSPIPAKKSAEGSFERRLKVVATGPLESPYFRAAVGGKIVAIPDSWFVVDNAIRLRFPGAQGVIRDSAGRKELLVPFQLKDGSAELLEEIVW